MKKIFSMLLAVLMLVSALPVAYAADVDYTAGTAVVYTASNSADYSITVPASIDPGKSGTVTLSGSWASNQTVKVTADSSVTLTNSINANDQKTLAVTFAGMEKAGDNSEAKTYTETVSVAAMPSDALFGSWDGKFNYYVELVEDATGSEEATTISFTIGDYGSFQADNGMTWAEWLESDYNTYGFTYDAENRVCDFQHDWVVLGEEQIYRTNTIEANAAYTIDVVGEEAKLISFSVIDSDGVETTYQAEEGMTFGEWVSSEYNTSNGRIYLSESNTIVVDGLYIAMPDELVPDGFTLE